MSNSLYPGSVQIVKYALASIASDAAAGTFPVGRVPYNCKVKSAHIQFGVSRASGTKGNSLTLANLGTDGTGTTGLGTHQATAAFASYNGLALSLAATPTVTAGGNIGFIHASHSAGTTVPAGEVTLALEYI